MENTAHSTQGVEDLYQKLTLEEEEGGVIDFAQVSTEGNQQELKWCIVGRFLTDRSINFIAMKNTLAAIWRPVKGVCIKNLSTNLYIFQFFHELDVDRVFRDGPWTFDHHLLVMAPLGIGVNPNQIPLFQIHIWVQIYDLPSGFMSERVASEIGNYIGNYVEADPNNFSGIWRSYMRVRVSLDVRQPLKRRMKIKKTGEDWSWANFKYEKLPTFCFFCGIIGHLDKFCEKFFDYPDKSVEKFFGAWLRAPSRRQTSAFGERWLRSDPPSVKSGDIPNDQDHSKVEIVVPKVAGSANDYNHIPINCDVTGSMGETTGKHCVLRGKGKVTVEANVDSSHTHDKDSLIVVDPKRRRIAEDSVVGYSLVGQSSPFVEVSKLNPTNFFEAGSGLQARQEL